MIEPDETCASVVEDDDSEEDDNDKYLRQPHKLFAIYCWFVHLHMPITFSAYLDYILYMTNRYVITILPLRS